MGKCSRFLGYCFVCFDTLAEAEEFTRRRLVFEDKTLVTKISIEHEQYILTSLQEAKAAKKVFVDSIPKEISKKELYDILAKFGEIEAFEYVKKDQKVINIAYVTFKDPASAKECVSKKFILRLGNFKVFVNYAKPNLTKNMLLKVHPKLRKFILGLHKNRAPYDPSKLAEIYDEIISKNQNIYNVNNHNQGKKKTSQSKEDRYEETDNSDELILTNAYLADKNYTGQQAYSNENYIQSNQITYNENRKMTAFSGSNVHSNYNMTANMGQNFDNNGYPQQSGYTPYKNQDQNYMYGYSPQNYGYQNYGSDYNTGNETYAFNNLGSDNYAYENDYLSENKQYDDSYYSQQLYQQSQEYQYDNSQLYQDPCHDYSNYNPHYLPA